MKHTLCILMATVVVMITSSQLAAQQRPSYANSAKWFTIGAKASYNITPTHDKIYESSSFHSGMRQGGSVGMYMRLGTNFFCQPEVLYSFALYNATRDIAGNKLEQDLQNHTIDVPVLFGYSPICSETFKFRLLLGPRFAFDVHQDSMQNAVPTDVDNITASMSKMRVGIDCGIGFDFWKISLDLRYVLISDVYKHQYLNFETNEWKKVVFPISTFNIAIGYNIWGNNMPSKAKQKYDPSVYDFFKKGRNSPMSEKKYE